MRINNFIFVAIFVTFSFFATILGGANLYDCAKFLFAQSLFVLVPGMFLNSIIKHDYGNNTKFYFSSYALGYGLTIIEYLFCMYLHIQQYVYIPAVFISLISLIYLYKNNKFGIHAQRKDIIVISILLMVCYSLSMLGFEGCNLPPQGDRILVTDQDHVYWLRNCVSVSQGMPLKDMSFLGQTFQYHYFSCVGIAFLHYLTGIELSLLCFVYSYFIHITIFIGSIYILGDHVINNKKNLYLSMCLILFVPGLEQVCDIYYLYHIYYYVAMTEALAFSLLSFYYFIIIYEKKEKDYFLFFVGLFVYFLAIGLKATLSCFTLIGICVGCLYIMFKHKMVKKGLIVGLGYMFSFVSALFILISGSTIENSRNTYELSFSGTILHSHFFKFLYENLNEFSVCSPINYIIVFVIFLLCINPLLSYLVFKGMKKSCCLSDINVMMLSITIIAILCGVFFNQFGMAQMYFFIAAFPFGYIVSVSMFGDCEIYETWKKSFIILMIIVSTSIVSIICPYGFLMQSARGISKIFYIDKRMPDPSNDMLLEGELEGLRWIKENTPQESIVISNRVLVPGGQTTSYTSAFSERQVYYECYRFVDSKGIDHVKKKLDLIRRVYNNDKDAISFIKKEGVNYLISYKIIENAEVIKGNIEYDGVKELTYIPPKKKVSGNIVFENKDIYVIEL